MDLIDLKFYGVWCFFLVVVCLVFGDNYCEVILFLLLILFISIVVNNVVKIMNSFMLIWN